MAWRNRDSIQRAVKGQTQTEGGGRVEQDQLGNVVWDPKGQPFTAVVHEYSKRST